MIIRNDVLRGRSLLTAMTTGDRKMSIPRLVSLSPELTDSGYVDTDVISVSERELESYLMSNTDSGAAASGTADITQTAVGTTTFSPASLSAYPVVGVFGEVEIGNGGGSNFGVSLAFTYGAKSFPATTFTETIRLTSSATGGTQEFIWLFSALQKDGRRELRPAWVSKDYVATVTPVNAPDYSISFTSAGSMTNATLRLYFIRQAILNVDTVVDIFTADAYEGTSILRAPEGRMHRRKGLLARMMGD